jgi:WD40 repeat protein
MPVAPAIVVGEIQATPSRWQRLRRLPQALLQDSPWTAGHSRWTAFFTLTLAGLIAGVLQGVVLYRWSFGNSRWLRGDAFVWDSIEHFAWIGIAVGLASGAAVSISRNGLVRISLGALLSILTVITLLSIYSEGRPMYMWGAFTRGDDPPLFSNSLGWGLFGGTCGLALAGLSHLVRRCSRKIRLLLLILLVGTLLSLRCQSFWWEAFNSTTWLSHRDHYCCTGCDLTREAPSSVSAVLLCFITFLSCILADLAEQLLRKVHREPWLPVTLAGANLLCLIGFNGAALAMPLTPHSPLKQLAFCSDTDELMTIHEGETLRRWQVVENPASGDVTLRETAKVRMHRAPIRYTAFALSSELAAAASVDGRIDLWLVPSCARFAQISVPDFPMTALSLSSDGSVLAAMDRASEIRLWQLPVEGSGQSRPVALKSIPIQKETLFSMALSPDGGRLVAPGLSGALAVYDTRSGMLLFSLGPESRCHRFDPPLFSPDGRSLLSCGGGGTIAILDLLDGSTRRVPTGFKCARPLALSRDRRTLVVSGEQSLQVLDLGTGKILKTSPNSSTVFTAGFSSDSRWLVLADEGVLEVVDRTRLPSPPTR